MLLSTPSMIARSGMRPASTTRVAWYVPLFAQGELGMVWDFTDISTLFQDTGATTPVTAVGQTISAIQDKITGYFAILTAGTATFQFDAVTGLNYCAMGTTANYTATGKVPSLLGGNALISFISSLQLTAAVNTFPGQMPCHIGPVSPSNGNAISIAQCNDSGQKLEMLQWGAARGRTAFQQSGTGVLIGRKNDGGGTTNSLDMWWKGTNIASPAGTFPNPLGAITTLDYSIGRAGGTAMNIYRSAVVNRVLTTTEIATLTTSALQ